MEVSYGGTKIASSALLSRGYATPDEWCVNLALSTRCVEYRPAFHTYETYEPKTITTTNTFKLESAIEI